MQHLDLFDHAKDSMEYHPSVHEIVYTINKNTAVEDFVQTCLHYPGYKLHHAMKGACLPTSLHRAIISDNLPLSKYIIKHVHSSQLDGMDILKFAIDTVTYGYSIGLVNGLGIVQLLVSKGVDVNRYQLGEQPLQLVSEAKNIVLAELLLEYGAHRFYRLNANGLSLIDMSFKSVRDLGIVKKILQEGTIEEEKFGPKEEIIYNKARMAVENRKFTFFSGKLDPGSLLSCFPKEIFAHILTCTLKPDSNRDKIRMVRQKIDATISKICQNELLFLHGLREENSNLKGLPLDLYREILSWKLALDEKTRTYQFQPLYTHSDQNAFKAYILSED